MKNNELEFKVVLFRDLITSFFSSIALILSITEYIIIPLTKGNTAMQTKLIVFMMLVITLIIHLYIKKRSRKFILKKVNDKIQITLNDKKRIVEEENLRLIYLFVKKYNLYTIRLNNSLYVININYASSRNDITIESHKEKITKLKTIITNKGKRRSIDYIPIILNVFIYLLLSVAFLLVVFLCTALLSGNEQWLSYFRN